MSSGSSHMMKTTKRGRPFLKDTMDLFATLIVSLKLVTTKQFFRSFPHSFQLDDAAANLGSLKFSQSSRGPDPRDPTRIITTTTTTTFTMTRDMAKAMCQHFMDARLIQNAADLTSNLFKERGVYTLTPKGLHILERFITKNGINADHLVEVFASEPICMKLLHLERRSSDDEIIVSQPVVTALFRRFAGRQPNYMDNTSNLDATGQYHERAKGIPLMDHRDSAIRNAQGNNKYCFSAVTALEWLCDFTSIVGRDEAAEMAAHFVRFGLVQLVSDKRKTTDAAVIFTVRGTGTNGAQVREFRCTAKAIYRITEDGRRVARWDQPTRLTRDSPNTSSSHLPERTSSDAANLASTTDAKVHRRISMAERLKAEYNNGEKKDAAALRESNSDRLNYILEEPALRSLFREFLRGNFCEENLSFWLEVQDLKRKFSITSSAAPSARAQVAASKSSPGQAAMEKHHESLIQMAFVIYNTYLAPHSQCELNIDHSLRNELINYLNDVMQDHGGKGLYQGRMELEQASTFTATQLQTMIRLYERIQHHVFRLMATDSVPKFIKTSRFIALRNWVEEYDTMEDPTSGNPTHPPGLDDNEEVGRTYVTISQAANEKAMQNRGGSKTDLIVDA
ncbi:regulator of G protein signaling superfamily [Exidia glandulosa HHB12029]|uniref:Regulator of G protein signaling superfamily n=1 Tax=Exidia glandulosa HHB12029 TaxID=1314781 RepID=A0A165R2C4_EXIGL|nr:regulator of G protein signaling superfamily [Exidia glandulosa HHB12029]